MAKMHRGCLLIGNLPRHWADEPEKTAKTLQQILPAPILQNLCCIQVSPDQVHKALVGLLAYLYVKIWMRTNQLEASTYSRITTTILGGVNVTHQLYAVYCQTWTPLDPRGAELKLRDQSEHGTVQNTGGNVHGDQLPTTIPSMWADKDIFQALLHGDDHIVLTTHPTTKSCRLRASYRKQSRWEQSGTTQLCVEARCGQQRPHVNTYRMFITKLQACLPTGG